MNTKLRKNPYKRLLLIVIGLFTYFGVQAQTVTQKISPKADRISLVDFFKQIEAKSDYTFVYRDVILNADKDISVDVTDKPISEVLTTVLGKKGLDYQVNNKTIVIIKQATAQQNTGTQTRTVMGNIKDASGEPLIGATIQVKETQNGTITDLDGNFSLQNVPENANLHISYIGYLPQELKVSGSGPLFITLREDVHSLEEVLVVGYGVQKKSDITGAVASLSSEMLEERPQTNIIQSLQGAIAGLNIAVTGSNAEGSSSSTTIRGSNSITASNKPLIILDGIPFDGPWSEINSSDVQSIEV
ncbi:MAG: carboxypeptidase-like regulatory domain-containing protein [Tannerellaceae bacterium]|nr:carboxypeptidase-like regulatory domain-containing protein [Tannerellaceae bacterium]